MKISADWIEPVAELMKAFEAAGHQILFVGGTVRNALLGLPVNDVDLATSALPNETIQIAQSLNMRTIPTGVDHGTVTIIHAGQSYEVTSFRKDVSTDGRRAVVAYSKDISDDARRRDFTMNAIYADRHGEVIDPLGGLKDLESRRVCFIELADTRIKEDYLRVLRYFRFVSLYSAPAHGMDPEILAAIAENLDGLDTLSKERIGAEMIKILASPDPALVLNTMEKIGVLARVLKGATAQFVAQLIDLERSPDWIYRLACIGADNAESALRLSKKDTKILANISLAISEMMPPAQTAYHYGARVAMGASLLRASFAGGWIDAGLEAEIIRGEKARFPIKSSDLSDEVQGKELGERLRALETKWIASDFKASREELLKL